jgi:hypothetical protein
MKGISSETPAFGLTASVIKSVNQKICVGEIFCDLANTFVHVNHEILLAKLHFYGIGEVGLYEGCFYLRSPNTTKNSSSVWGTLKHGVPQG